MDTEAALIALEKISISLHCWQGDNVGRFENPGGELTGGIAATGIYPGKARTADELRRDLDLVYSLLPGLHRLNLHATYLEADRQVERNALKALMMALLEPRAVLNKYEAEGYFTSRLALQEELKIMPFNAVWDYYCEQKGVPVGIDFMHVVKEYERKELSKR